MSRGESPAYMLYHTLENYPQWFNITILHLKDAQHLSYWTSGFINRRTYVPEDINLSNYPWLLRS